MTISDLVSANVFVTMWAGAFPVLSVSMVRCDRCCTMEINLGMTWNTELQRLPALVHTRAGQPVSRLAGKYA